jgi:hypothetical protein
MLRDNRASKGVGIGKDHLGTTAPVVRRLGRHAAANLLGQRRSGDIKTDSTSDQPHWMRLQAAFPITGCVQCEQRFASIGISLRHSGHFFVEGGATGSSLCMRAMSQLIGTTTKK